MHVSVSLSPASRAQDMVLFGEALGCCVVIDVLRASTVIATALSNGAASIIPLADVESARKLKTTMGGEALLCGERGGKRINGFDLGNSPLEYTREAVTAKSLIYASTNGSVALAQSPPSMETLAAGFVNLTSVVEHVHNTGMATTIICAGRDGGFSLEDAVCAGALMSKLWEFSDDVEPASDSAYAVQALWDRYKDSPAMALWQGEHGKYLISLGFGADLAVCAEVDSIPVVPTMRDGRIILRRS